MGYCGGLRDVSVGLWGTVEERGTFGFDGEVFDEVVAEVEITECGSLPECEWKSGNGVVGEIKVRQSWKVEEIVRCGGKIVV